MNLRALALLMVFLLLQAGGAWAGPGSACVVKPAGCQAGCCKFMTPEDAAACCHLHCGAEAPAPTTQAPPGQAARELVPVITWTLMDTRVLAVRVDAAKACPSWAGITAGRRAIHAVTLTVLHCAFLI